MGIIYKDKAELPLLQHARIGSLPLADAERACVVVPIQVDGAVLPALVAVREAVVLV